MKLGTSASWIIRGIIPSHYMDFNFSCIASLFYGSMLWMYIFKFFDSKKKAGIK